MIPVSYTHLYMTTIAAARATFKGIRYVQQHGQGEVKSLQQLHSEITY